MSTPLISFLLGTVLLILSCLVYNGHYIFKRIPIIFELRGEKIFALGTSLISLSLILGIFRQLNYLDPSFVKLIRLLLGISGVGLISLFLIKKRQILDSLEQWIFPIKVYLNSSKKISLIHTIGSLIIIYFVILAIFLYFGDRVGWEGDDVDQIEGFLNFSYKGKDLVYRYYWQPLAYQLNFTIYGLIHNPKIFFILPQIFGAANICILLFSLYIFSEKRLNWILCFSFLIVFPEILFCSLYYNSTVFAMTAMSFALLFLFGQKSPIQAIDLWNNIRYFILGITITSALFIRFDFVLSLPLIWCLMLLDKSLKSRIKAYLTYSITSLSLLMVFWLTDIFNPQQLIGIAKSHEVGAASWTMQESFASLYTITNITIWIVLIISLIYFVVSKIKDKNWKAFLLIGSTLPILYPIHTLTSPKYLIPGIIFLPFVLAKITLWLKKKVTRQNFQAITLGFIALSFWLQFISIQIDPKIPYLQITSEPHAIHLTTTHDGTRVSGAYLEGYNQVRKAQTNSIHPPIRFARKMAEAILALNKNVTVVYEDKPDTIGNEPWILTFSSMYLELEGYQVKYYDRQAKMVLLKNEKTVKMEKVNEAEYANYNNGDQGNKFIIKVPTVSHQDPQAFKKFFEDFYNVLDKIEFHS
ncbi:hypothetical protein [Aphanothece sacrum]|uniref:Glycosyltransferase RgtA/B/C/D-like domain-containing protein n=1 Tax=Aphanothece sacrum FPU1 TaxID=1920663 RepID=A0A401IBU6_APHSA|nr:hypothetical protein [Aphanothece sacrum]GBF78725.1 hypothetical protein AsFPU1_0114 [Aphanothece sacrum FPU1]GBF86958.1 hypothetical protein AsFPU3_4035 [Aphanothece sacrum FPU3]